MSESKVNTFPKVPHVIDYRLMQNLLFDSNIWKRNCKERWHFLQSKKQTQTTRKGFKLVFYTSKSRFLLDEMTHSKSKAQITFWNNIMLYLLNYHLYFHYKGKQIWRTGVISAGTITAFVATNLMTNNFLERKTNSLKFLR